MLPERQNMELPFVGGIDTKTDDRLIPPDRLLVLENGVFVKHGAVEKRPGHAKVPYRTIDGNNISTSPRGLTTRNDELVLLGKSNAYSYAEAQNAWVDRGFYTCMAYSSDDVLQVPANQSLPQCVTHLGFTMYVWEDSRTANTLRYAVQEDATGAWMVAETTVTTAEKPRCVRMSAGPGFMYADTGTNDIRLVQFNIGTFQVTSTYVTQSMASTRYYDATSNGTYAYVLWHFDDGGTPDTHIAEINGSGTMIRQRQWSTNVPTDNPSVVLNYANTYLGCGSLYSGGHMYNQVQLSDFMTVNAVTTSAITGTTITLVPASGGTLSEFSILLEVTAASDDIRYISVDGGSFLIRHSWLASKGFSDGESSFVVLGHASRTALQHAFYLVRIKPTTSTYNICGRMLYSEAAARHSKRFLYGVDVVNNGNVLQTALGFRRNLRVDAEAAGVITTGTGTGQRSDKFLHTGFKRFRFDPTVAPSSAQLGQTTYISGAQTWQYDGQSPVEAGFHMFPDVKNTATTNTDIAHTGSGTSKVDDGVYTYRVYYRYVSDAGEITWSGAREVQFTATSVQDTRLTIPTLAFTNRQTSTGRTNCEIAVYRAEVNTSQVFYFVGSHDPTSALYESNDITADTITFDDTVTDAVLVTNEVDYQFFGLPANFGPAGATNLAVAQSRLFSIGSGAPTDTVQHSLQHSDGAPVSWSDLVVSDLPDVGGKVIGVAEVNGIPIVFKQRAIVGLEGTGPANNLDGQGYVPKLLTTVVGCVDARTIVPYPDGVLFLSAKGWYHIGLDLQVEYIGARVEGFNSQSYVGGVAVPDTNHVVLVASSGEALMYDYLFGEWGTFPNVVGIDTVQWGTTMVILRSDGQVWVRTPDLYTDDGAFFRMRLMTGQIRPAEMVQSRWRVHELQLLGEYLSQHHLHVALYYNRETAPYEEWDFAPEDVIETAVWGDSGTSTGTWGSGAGTGTWGGEALWNDYQHEWKPKRTKTQTLRVEIYDKAVTTPGRSYRLSALGIEFTVLPGRARLAAERKI